MQKYLVFNDDKSSKFWEITLTENEHTVRFGKIGTQGQSKTKSFSSPEEAARDAEKLIQEKIKKGYVETSRGGISQDRYAGLLQCKDKKSLFNALCEHFAYLADFPGYEKVLSEIMKDVHSVKMDKETLVVGFRGGKTLHAGPPADLSQYNSFPDSYKKCAAVHETLGFPEAGWSLYFGHPGSFEAEYLEDVDSDLLSIIKASDAICPISDYSDWWIYHPEQKTPQGEPGICFFSHEGGDLAPAEMIPVGSLFLKRMAQIQEIEVEFPEPVFVDQDPMTWWNSLSKNWQWALYRAADIDEGKKVNDGILRKIMKITEFNFHEDECDLNHLEPLTMLGKLDHISISRQPSISSLEPLHNLDRMESIRITGSPIENLSPIKGMKRLKYLDLEKALLSDLSPISGLLKLERLRLKESKVTDLSPLAKLKNLEELTLSGSPIDSLKTLPTLKSLRSLDIRDTAITDIAPLKQFPRLRNIDLSKTGVTDLTPVDKNDDIFIFSCRESKVSFQELLRFLASRYEKIMNSELDVYSNYTESPETFMEQLASLDKIPEGAEAITSFWVSQFTIHYIKQKKTNEAVTLLKTLMKHRPLKMAPKPAQELVSNSIPVFMAEEEPELEEQILSLLPEPLTLSRLAFNLSCMYAVRKDKNNMLEYVNRALQLNHDPQKFKSDSDFDAYQNDPDFLAVLTGPRSVDPAVDPAGWWNALDGEWREVIYDAVNGVKSKEDIAKIFDIETLHIREAVTLEPLRYLTGLKELTIEYSKTTDLDPIAQLTNLEKLSLLESDNDKTKFKDISPLEKLEKLKQLIIDEHEFNDLSALKNMKNLEWLRLVRLPAKSIDFLTGTKKLKSVEIQLMNITDIGPLKENHGIADLSLYSTDVHDISILKNMKNIESLTLSGCKVSDISALENCKKLKKLRLGGCPVTTLKPLEELPDLEEISIHDTQIQKEEAEAFKKSHPKCEVN